MATSLWSTAIVLVGISLACCASGDKARHLSKRRVQDICPERFYYEETSQVCCPCSRCPRMSSNYVVSRCLDLYRQHQITDINLVCESFVPNACWDYDYAYEHYKKIRNATKTTSKATTTTTTTTKKPTTTTTSTTTEKATASRKPSTAGTRIVLSGEQVTPKPKVVAHVPKNDDDFLKMILIAVLAVVVAFLMVCVLVFVLMKCKKSREFIDKCRCRPEQSVSVPVVAPGPVAAPEATAAADTEPLVAPPPLNNCTLEGPVGHPADLDPPFPHKESGGMPDNPPSYPFEDSKSSICYNGETRTDNCDSIRGQPTRKNETVPFDPYQPSVPSQAAQPAPAAPIHAPGNSGNMIIIQTMNGDINLPSQSPPHIYTPPNTGIHRQPTTEQEPPSHSMDTPEHFRSNDYNSVRSAPSPCTSSSEPPEHIPSRQTFPIRNDESCSLLSSVFKRPGRHLHDPPPTDRRPGACRNDVHSNRKDFQHLELQPSDSSSHSETAAKFYSPLHPLDAPARHFPHGLHQYVDRHSSSLEQFPEMVLPQNRGVESQLSVEVDEAEPEDSDEDIYSSNEASKFIKRPPNDSHGS